MDYEPFKVSYTAGQPYVGATLSMYPPQGDSNMGNFIAWDGKGKIVWSNTEQFSVWSGALTTAGGVVFYGTLEGYLKAVDPKLARSCSSSGRRRASSATSSPTSTRASSIWRALGRRRLGWHRPRGRPDQADRWSGCCRWLRGVVEVHRSRRLADGVLAAERLNRYGPARCYKTDPSCTLKDVSLVFFWKFTLPPRETEEEQSTQYERGARPLAGRGD